MMEGGTIQAAPPDNLGIPDAGAPGAGGIRQGAGRRRQPDGTASQGQGGLPGARRLPRLETREGTGNVADLTPPDNLDHETDILTNHWRVRIGELTNLALKSLTTQVASYSLTPMEFDLLRVCYSLDRECTATELVRFLPVDPARISRLVNELVDKGLLRRRRTREDRRIIMLRLSDDGRALIADIMADITQYNARLIEAIGADEMQVFLRVTSHIIANLETVEGDR